MADWMAEVASVVPLPNVAALTVAQMVVLLGIPPGMPGFQVVRRASGMTLPGASTATVAAPILVVSAALVPVTVTWKAIAPPIVVETTDGLTVTVSTGTGGATVKLTAGPSCHAPA